MSSAVIIDQIVLAQLDSMQKSTTPSFIDVFAGCGGLSLGFANAGFRGICAVEKSSLAFDTLKHNLVQHGLKSFDWPEWLPMEAMTCEDLLAKYADELGRLKGGIDVLVGGPPCQGFSTAGRRDPSDPRNKMTEQYLSLVGLLEPSFIVIENVAGYQMKFDDTKRAKQLVGGSGKKSYAEYVVGRLDELGYDVSSGLVNCSDFGVPQARLRFIMICERRKAISEGSIYEKVDLFQALMDSRSAFRRGKGLPNRPVAVKNALSDLECKGKELVPCTDSDVRGFNQTLYRMPVRQTAFQKLMSEGCPEAGPNSRRLAKHRPATLEYFRKVRAVCRPGRSLSLSERKLVGTRKHSTTVLNASRPAPTITTLPDDILHYSEDRILTVRENARLQSFPDWFEFKGKYTTGGKMRKNECPRYTQVGNAVPPLLAEAIGVVIQTRIQSLSKSLIEGAMATLS